MTTRPRRIRKSLMMRAALGLLIATAVFGNGVGGAGASTGCGEYSFGFAGTRLLNDGISTSAGPFPITLPAGTYDVKLESFDDHEDHPGQVAQTAEQFYVTLDSGWVSPPSVDIAENENYATTVHAGQVVGESTAISVHHLGRGNVNSVEVLCVGFTPAAAALNVVEEPEDKPEAPAPADPLSLTRPTSESPDSTLKPDRIDPLSLTRPIEGDGVATEVQGQVEVGPLLALTGPSTSPLIALLGTSLVSVGALLVATDRRRQSVRA